MPRDSSSTLGVWMGEVSNGLSKSWQMRSDVPPPPSPLSFSRMKRKDHTSVASLRDAGVGEPRRAPEGPRHGQHGFGYFCRNKSGSAAGPKPGNTENHEDIRIGATSAMRSHHNAFFQLCFQLFPRGFSIRLPPHRCLTPAGWPKGGTLLSLADLV